MPRAASLVPETLWHLAPPHSLVLLAIVRQDQVLKLHLHLDPLLVSQRGPDVVWLCDSGFVWLQDHLRPIVVHVQSTQNQDETRESLEGDMDEVGDSSIVGGLLLTLASQQSKHHLQILQVPSPHKSKEICVAQELDSWNQFHPRETLFLRCQITV